MNRILLIDDDPGLCEMLAEYLATEGFRAEAVHDGAQGLERARAGGMEAIVLDQMLPGMGGIELLRRLRIDSPAPILMLTARGDIIDPALGLELGADDYLPEPCAPRELIGRLRNLLRGAPATESSPAPLRVGPLEVRPATRDAFLDDQPLPLTRIEHRLLERLAREPGRTVSRQALSEAALGRAPRRYDRSLELHMAGLLRKPGLGNLIRMVRGVGYQLAMES